MRPIGPLTITAGDGPVIPLDIYASGYNGVRMSVNEADIGTLTYEVEFTGENPFNAAFDPATAVWNIIGPAAVINGSVFDVSGVAAAAIRLRITGGAGSLTYTVTQTGLQ